ncbi:hypothetical protein OXPF_42860 [Oxobacter pfennigii]|uniref:DUF4367 domain-containing protein n=1 Tax=Oxobacter pfennigii TaxID=36849 RepID=A0A0P9ABP7_9CLOT|nr:DUF4367 domain-containing protein [Oxobacter pfennigii]KPU42501.1 hypothetical protein OXPF_42860 [Oxobacter pfennigii]
MKCPDTGKLQEYIDCELDINLKKEVENHISGCDKCSKTVKKLKENDDFTFSKLKNLRAFSEDNFVPTHILHTNAPSEINGIKQFESKKGVNNFMIKHKKAITAAIISAAVITCITVQPVRTAIASTLSIFRVQKMEAVSITLNDIKEIRDKLSSSNPEIDMDKIGKIKIDGGEYVNVTQEELKTKAGFDPAFPSALEDIKAEIGVALPASMELTLNVPNINEILKTLGAEKLLPSDIDGKTFTVDFSSGVNLNYSTDKKYINIAQTMAPVIHVPDNVDVDSIYESLVELPLIPQNLRNQLLSIKDWKTTLPIPVIEEETEEIDLNGTKAFLFTKDFEDASVTIEHSSGGTQKIPDKNSDYSSIMWYKDGIIYNISGNISGDEIVDIAKSMR